MRPADWSGEVQTYNIGGRGITAPLTFGSGVRLPSPSWSPMDPLRYLAAADVAASMPPLAERLELADRVLRALGTDAELPPKIGVHPRQIGSLAHAMPALLRGAAADGADDLLGMKWIAGFPANGSVGLPAYNALVVLNDPRTGLPLAVMDAAAITAARTAAVSGVAIRALMPRVSGRAARVAILGAGAQAQSHIPVIGYLMPGAELAITDIDPARSAAAAARASATTGIGSARSARAVREAVVGADLVVSVVSFGPNRQTLDPDWLEPESLFVAVDYDMQAPATLARAAFFVVDERDGFLAARAGVQFAGYPDPDSTLGEVLRAEGSSGAGGVGGGAGGATTPGETGGGADRRPSGRVLVSHLGVGLSDVVFGAAILARAERLGLGRMLPR
jgi:ornithine cyclodeaminase/alanine dehydrogenase-like protein (mu-crystallin family)